MFALLDNWARPAAAGRAPTVENSRVTPLTPRPSLRFIDAASKLTLLYLCKGNALKCFSYATL